MPFGTRSLDDPRSRQVVAALEAVGDSRSSVVLPAMSDRFRADLRAQLVAVTPRLVEEGVRPGTETAARPARTARTAPVVRPAARTRPMTVLLAGAAVVVLGMGGATWLARGALPGDALYGLKRTAESVDVSLSGSDLDKGHAQLVDAQKRVEEVDALLGRTGALALSGAPTGGGYAAAGGISDATATLIVSTLQAADTDTHTGVTTIGDDAVSRGDAAGLDLVVAWAGGQRDRIDALVARIPAGPAHDQAETSATEIRAGLQRATDLLTDYTDTTCRRDRDAFGPTTCLPPVPTAAPPVTTDPPATTPPSTGGGGGGGGAPAPTPTATSTPTPAASGLQPGALPTGSSASATSVAPPVTVDSCGVQISLPVAGVSLGTCAPTR